MINVLLRVNLYMGNAAMFSIHDIGELLDQPFKGANVLYTWQCETMVGI